MVAWAAMGATVLGEIEEAKEMEEVGKAEDAGLAVRGAAAEVDLGEVGLVVGGKLALTLEHTSCKLRSQREPLSKGRCRQCTP